MGGGMSEVMDKKYGKTLSRQLAEEEEKAKELRKWRN